MCIRDRAYSLYTRDSRLHALLADPCTLTMLANRWGADVLPEEAMYACYDSTSENCSNPGFAAAFLGCYGLESYVVYTDCAGLKKEIKNGCLCAVRLHSSEGEEQYRSVVVRGLSLIHILFGPGESSLHLFGQFRHLLRGSAVGHRQVVTGVDARMPLQHFHQFRLHCFAAARCV